MTRYKKIALLLLCMILLTGCLNSNRHTLLKPTDTGYDGEKGEISVKTDRIDGKSLASYGVDITTRSYLVRCDDEDVMLEKRHHNIDGNSNNVGEVFTFDVSEKADYIEVEFYIEFQNEEELRTFFNGDIPECYSGGNPKSNK